MPNDFGHQPTRSLISTFSTENPFTNSTYPLLTPSRNPILVNGISRIPIQSTIGRNPSNQKPLLLLKL